MKPIKTYKALRDEAAAVGDMEQVDLCDRALRGDLTACRECDRVIDAAAAMDDDKWLPGSLRVVALPPPEPGVRFHYEGEDFVVHHATDAAVFPEAGSLQHINRTEWVPDKVVVLGVPKKDEL